MPKRSEFSSRHFTVTAYAKINIGLELEGKRPDGYHNIRTVFQSISLHDTLVFEKKPRGFSLSSDDPALPLGKDNLILRAFGLLKSRFSGGIHIHVKKRIPMQAGLGGGSSDAAATLRGLRAWLNLKVTDFQLHQMALKLGSDVPYFLRGGTALGLGRGEELAPLPDLPKYAYVLAMPARGLSTSEIYARASRLRKNPKLTRNPKACRILPWKHKGPEIPGPWPENELEKAALDICPELQSLRRKMAAEKPLALSMTGSGSALYALAESPAHAKAMVRKLKPLAHWTHTGSFVSYQRFQRQ